MKQSTNGQIPSAIAEHQMPMASRISLTDIQSAIFSINIAEIADDAIATR